MNRMRKIKDRRVPEGFLIGAIIFFEVIKKFFLKYYFDPMQKMENVILLWPTHDVTRN